jgi:hypothetical protein
MVFFTRPLAARLPEHSRVALFSTDMLWTIIVTAQGASAMYSLIGGLTDKAYFNSTMGLDTVFFPLAVFGLLRLFPAFWLTDDFHFAYENRNSIELTSFRPTQDGPRATGEDRKETYSLPQFANSRDSLDHTQDTVAELSQFRQTSFWPSRIFRVCYMLPLLCLFVFTFLFITPFRGKFSATLTAFLVGLFFFVFFAISIVIFLYYFARGYTTTTTIPCIASTWYKVYTFLLFFLMGTMMVIAALETRKTPCGRYTSLSGTYGDLKACWDGKNMALPIRPDMHGVFALASNNPMRPDDEETIENTWLYDFTGTCLGMVSANSGVNQGSNYSAMYDGEEWAYFIASLQALEFSQQ